jgi:hypothetical protein
MNADNFSRQDAENLASYYLLMLKRNTANTIHALCDHESSIITNTQKRISPRINSLKK